QDFYVPVDFVTDFASVPRALIWLIPRYGVYTKAAIVHDYLCKTKVVPRADADGLFRRIMAELHVPFLRRWVMWAAVRLGSFLSGMNLPDFLRWLIIAAPMIAFVAIPTLLIMLALVMFWIAECVAYVVLKLFSRKP